MVQTPQKSSTASFNSSALTEMIKRIISTILLSLAVSSPALADQNHLNLLERASNTGLNVFVNDPYCDQTGADGMFSSNDKGHALLICQDNKIPGSTTIQEWTANDLDTIRHEMVHVVQNCASGSILDSNSNPLYEDYVALVDEFGPSAALQVWSTYMSNGVRNSNTLRLEIEAFYIAREFTAQQVASLYEEFCVQ